MLQSTRVIDPSLIGDYWFPLKRTNTSTGGYCWIPSNAPLDEIYSFTEKAFSKCNISQWENNNKKFVPNITTAAFCADYSYTGYIEICSYNSNDGINFPFLFCYKFYTIPDYFETDMQAAIDSNNQSVIMWLNTLLSDAENGRLIKIGHDYTSTHSPGYGTLLLRSTSPLLEGYF